MNKINAILAGLILLTVIVGCSKNQSENKPKTAQSSPTVYETPFETANQTNKNEVGSSPSKSGELAELEAAAEKDPKNFDAHFQLAKKYQSVKQDEKAVGAYKKAVEVKPDSAEANYELGKIYFDRKSFQDALPFLQKAAKIKYTSPVYLVALGDNLRELKRCNDAIPPYGNSVNYNDKIAAAYYGMGLCYLEVKNRIAAETQLRSLEKLDKNLAKQLETKIKQYQ